MRIDLRARGGQHSVIERPHATTDVPMDVTAIRLRNTASLCIAVPFPAGKVRNRTKRFGNFGVTGILRNSAGIGLSVFPVLERPAIRNGKRVVNAGCLKKKKKRNFCAPEFRSVATHTPTRTLTQARHPSSGVARLGVYRKHGLAATHAAMHAAIQPIRRADAWN